MPNQLSTPPGIPPLPVAGNIPLLIRTKPRWVPARGGWALKQLKGVERWKMDKTPLRPDGGGGASHRNPDDWQTFESALDTVQALHAGGVPAFMWYVIDPDDNLVYIDRDGSVDPSTHEVDPEAYAELQDFGYVEVSASGSGLRAIAFGEATKREDGDRALHVDGYISVTGQVFDGHGTVTVQQDAIDSFATLIPVKGNGAAGEVMLPPPTQLPVDEDIAQAALATVWADLSEDMRGWLGEGVATFWKGDESDAVHAAAKELMQAGVHSQMAWSVMWHNEFCRQVAENHRGEHRVAEQLAYLWASVHKRVDAGFAPASELFEATDGGSRPVEPGAISEAPESRVARMGKVEWELFPDAVMDPAKLGKDGKPEGPPTIKSLKPTIENLEVLLREYDVDAQVNVFSRKPTTVFPWKTYGERQGGAADDALSEVLTLAERTGLPVKHLDKFLSTIARRNQVNPVADYMGRLVWDSQDHIEHLCQHLHVPERHIDAMRISVRRWLIQACAAAHGGPFARADALARYEYVLTMKAAQGIGKSKWLKELVPLALRGLAKESVMLDVKDKDSVMQATSHWLAELGEIDATFKQSDNARMKAFLSSESDEFRQPYGLAASQWPRRTVYMGTVNTTAFLSDPTGSRRYLAFQLERRDPLGVDIEQMWAQAWAAMLAGEQWWPTDAEEAVLAAAREEFDATADNHCVEAVLERFGDDFSEAAIDTSRRWLLKDMLREAGIWDRDYTQHDKRVLSQWLERTNRDANGVPRCSLTHGAKRWWMPRRPALQSADVIDLMALL